MGSSIIPSGQAKIALRLAQLPQPAEQDCSVELDQLPMVGLNYAALQRGLTADQIAKEAVYLWLALFFAEEEQGKEGGEGNTSQSQEPRN